MRAPRDDEDDPVAAREKARAERDVLIHSFGNLTLLTAKQNKEVSNGPFRTKRRQIAGQSLLRLNAYFQDLPDSANWTEAAIAGRGINLLETAARTWPHPQAPA